MNNNNIDDILAAYAHYDENEYAEEKKNCLYQAICTMIGDPQWSPSWFLKLVRANNGYPPASALKQLEQWCPLGAPMNVYDGHEVHWNGESLIVKETGEKHSFLYFERVILCYQTHEGGHAVCIRKFQIKEYAHLVWDTVIVRSHTPRYSEYHPAWHNPDLDRMLWVGNMPWDTSVWRGDRLSKSRAVAWSISPMRALIMDERQDTGGGGILDPSAHAAPNLEEAKQFMKRYIDEHSETLRSLLLSQERS